MLNIEKLALAEVNRLGAQLFHWWVPAPSLCQFRYSEPWDRKTPRELSDYMIASGYYYGRLAFYTKRGIEEDDERALAHYERELRYNETRVKSGGHALFACCAKAGIENVGILGDIECPVCLDTILAEDDDAIVSSAADILGCGHVLHQACRDALPKPECPMCRYQLDIDD